MTDGEGRAVISRVRGLMEAPLERDLVGLNVDTGLCYGFNETAAAIWRQLAQPKTFDTLLNDLSLEFETTANGCREDVARLVRELTDAGLVTVAATP